MKSIDLVEDISFPAQRDQLIKKSSAYKAAIENDIDTDIIEGKQPDENSGVVKFEPIDETEQRLFMKDVANFFLKEVPKDTLISIGKGGVNFGHFLNNIAYALDPNPDEMDERAYQSMYENLNKAKQSLSNFADEESPFVSKLVGMLGQSQMYTYPIYKKLNNSGLPKAPSLIISSAMSEALAFDKSETFFTDSKYFRAVKETFNLPDDTPMGEVVDKFAQFGEYLLYTDVGEKLLKGIIAARKMKADKAQQGAIAVGGGASSGAILDNTISNTENVTDSDEIPPLEFNIDDDQSSIPDTVNEYGFEKTAGLGPTVVKKMLGTKAGEVLPSLKKLSAEGFEKKTLSNFNRLADEGKLGKDWYNKSGQNILNYVRGDKQAADQFAQLLAIYSPQKPVATNTQFAIKAWNKFQSGEKIWDGEILERATIPQDLNITQKAKFKRDLIGKYGGAKRVKGQKSTGLEVVELDDSGNVMVVRHGEYDNIAEKTKDLKSHLLLNENIPWNGRKTNNFYNNIMKEINPELKQGATIDLWMNRAGGFVSQELSDGVKYSYLEDITNEVAKQKNWDIDQAQAAIWVATKGRFDSTKKIFADAALEQNVGVRSGGSIIPIKGKEKEFADLRFNTAMDYELTSKDTGKAAFDFADALEDNLAFVSWETVPGTYSKHLNQLSSATPNIKSEYQFKVSQIMNDEEGSDIIAKKLNLLSPGHFEAPGYYQGVSNPSGQTKIATTRVKGAGKDVTQMDAPSEELLELYSAVRGVVLQQDAIGYHRFIKAGSQKNANSVAVRTDKKFTADQMKKFGTALDKEFGDGHAVIAKEKGVVVINVGDLDNIEFQKRLENLVELNVDDAAHIIYYKNGNLITRDKTDYGKNYKQILGQTRRSDIRQLVRDLLTKKKDLDKEFSEKYRYDFDERAFSEFDELIRD